MLKEKLKKQEVDEFQRLIGFELIAKLEDLKQEYNSLLAILAEREDA